MDYNDRLWEKELAKQARKELAEEVNEMTNGPNFSISLANGTLKVDDTGYMNREAILDGIDNLKGTPEEQIKNLVSEKLSRALHTVEEAVGWPTVVKNYENYEITVSIKASINHVADDDIDLVLPVDDYNSNPGIPFYFH